MRDVILVASGGALGAVARYAVGLTVARRAVLSGWPLGTFAVNLVGCLGIGLVMGMAERNAVGDSVRLFMVTGALGGFTTFSALGFETLALLRAGSPGVAFANAGLQLLLGVAAAAAGFAWSRSP